MKKNIVFFISYLVLSLNLFSQEIKESNFSKFKSFFNNNDANSGLNEIPLSLCHKILNNNMVDEYVVSIHACNIYEKGENIYAIIELMYPEGGYSSSYTLILFSNEGKLESSISVGYNMLDADGGVQSKLNMINDSLLEVKKENVKYNDEEKKEVYKTEYSYFVINEQGVNNIEIQEVSKGRLYPKASNIILCLSELKNITKTYLKDQGVEETSIHFGTEIVEDILEEAAQMLEEEAESKIKTLTILIEPIATILAGCGAGYVIFIMFSPMIKIFEFLE